MVKYKLIIIQNQILGQPNGCSPLCSRVLINTEFIIQIIWHTGQLIAKWQTMCMILLLSDDFYHCYYCSINTEFIIQIIWHTGQLIVQWQTMCTILLLSDDFYHCYYCSCLSICHSHHMAYDDMAYLTADSIVYTRYRRCLLVDNFCNMHSVSLCYKIWIYIDGICIV